MTEGKRRDPRAKVLSMTVRYKSATVDEFIENHSHDVSRGGIFIKTGSPFPAGTLIKFEVKIDDDRAVLQGVGRVVWKRDQDAGDGSGPAGMGVKFIKIGPESRQLIDQVVSSADRTSGAFDVGARQAGVDPKPSILPTASHAPMPEPTRRAGGTVMGLGPLDDRPTPIMARPAVPKPPGVVAAPPTPSSPPPELSALDAPALDDISTDISGEVEDDEEFDEESTAVHQAGQLLEAAFTGLGGSMEEAKVADKPKPPVPDAAVPRTSQPREAVAVPVSGGSRSQPPGARNSDGRRSGKKQGKRKGQGPRRASSGPTSASAPMHDPPKVNRPQVTATTPPARGAGKTESGGGSAVVWVLLIGAVVAAAVYLSSSETPSSDDSAMPAPTPTPVVAAPEPPAAPVPSATPIPSATSIPSAEAPPEAPGSAGAASAPDDTAAPSTAAKAAARLAAEKDKAEEAKAAEKLATQMAEAAAAVRAAKAAAPKPAARPKPKPAPAAAPAAPVEPAPSTPEAAAPAPTPGAPAPAPPAPAPAPAPAPEPPPTPKPTPAPTPSTPAGDNPY